ncbi:MAG: DUF3306 domain-containing protein [Geminicoccaceae bacterium]
MTSRDRGSPPKTGEQAPRKTANAGELDAELGDEGFLGRWSRRKSEARTAEDAHQVVSLENEQSEEAEVGEVGIESDAAAFDPSTLPDIDKMDAGSDFSVFMQSGVPPALKTKALRKLWRLKPELANLDGLIDYGEDLTGSFKVVDHLKTAYQVGKGFLSDEDKPDEAVPDKTEEFERQKQGDDAVAEASEPEGLTGAIPDEPDDGGERTTGVEDDQLAKSGDNRKSTKAKG